MAASAERLVTPSRQRSATRVSDRGRPRVSVVIPARNEAANLPHVLPRIPEWVDEVILVDGQSTDGTADVARAVRPGIRIVAQTGRGKGDALRLGFAAAGGDIVVAMDADGSTDPAELASFVEALAAGADLAKGSRYLEGGGSDDLSPLRLVGNAALTALVRLLFGARYTDLCYGYFAFWRRVLPKLSLEGDGFEIETLINVSALRAGLEVAEVPSFEGKRIHGESNLRAFADGWRVLRAIVREALDLHRLRAARAIPAPLPVPSAGD